VSECGLQKRARARGGVTGKRAVVGASTVESADGRLGKGVVVDRRGPQASKGERANGRSKVTERVHRAARANGRVRKRIDADRTVPPSSGRERGRVCADTGCR
jgi:hypothetical protein